MVVKLLTTNQCGLAENKKLTLTMGAFGKKTMQAMVAQNGKDGQMEKTGRKIVIASLFAQTVV
jgi:hypothetical protein